MGTSPQWLSGARWPSPLEALAIGATGAKGFMGARAATTEAEAMRDAAEARARIGMEEAGEEAARRRREARREIGREVTMIGASGVQFAGSPLQRLTENAVELEREARAIERTAQRNARLQYQIGRAAIKGARYSRTAGLLSSLSDAAMIGAGSLRLPGIP